VRERTFVDNFLTTLLNVASPEAALLIPRLITRELLTHELAPRGPLRTVILQDRPHRTYILGRPDKAGDEGRSGRVAHKLTPQQAIDAVVHVRPSLAQGDQTVPERHCPVEPIRGEIGDGIAGNTETTVENHFVPERSPADAGGLASYLETLERSDRR
jgi:hypothetical protein